MFPLCSRYVESTCGARHQTNIGEQCESCFTVMFTFTNRWCIIYHILHFHFQWFTSCFVPVNADLARSFLLELDGLHLDALG